MTEWNSEEQIKRIQEFSELTDDWDSYGGRPISPIAIANAIEFVSKMNWPDDDHANVWAVPTSGGAVMLDCNNVPDDTTYCCIEFTPQGAVEVYFGCLHE